MAGSPVDLAPIADFLLAGLIWEPRVERTYAAPQKSVPVPQKFAN